MRKAMLAVPVLLLVASCSSSGATASSPSSSASSAPADGGTYPDADAILTALQTAGAPCTSPEPVANPTLTGTLSMVDCDSEGGQSDTVVVVFDTQAHVIAYAASLTTGAMSDIAADAVVVYGRNWAVNTSGAGYATMVQRVLGGQVAAGPSASAS